MTNFKNEGRKSRDKEDQYKVAFETAATSIVIIENDMTISLINKEFERLSGFKREEIEGKKKWTEFVARKEDLERMKRYHIDRRKDPNSVPKNYEFKFIDRYGKLKDVYISVDIIPGTDKSVASLLDITERKEREEEYKSLINGMNETAFVINFDGKFIEVNDRALEVLEYSREEFLKMGPTDIDAHLSKEEIENLIKGMRKGEKQVFSTLHRTKKGKIIPVEISSSLITYKGNPAILSIARDITDREKAEKALRESEERFQTVIENMPYGVCLHNIEGEVLLVNNAFCELSGYKREELLKMRIKDFDPESETRKDKKRFWLKLGKGEFARLESTLYRKDGSSFPAEICISAISLRGEKMILGIVQNIKERKEAIEKLKESEEKYRNLYESLVDAFVRFDMEGNIIEFNKTYLEMLGYSEEEIKKMKNTDLTPSKWHKMEKEIIKEQIIKKGYSEVYEKEYIRKGGEIFPVELRAFLIRNNDGTPNSIWAIVRDITERKELEKELRKIERLESLGVLAGGIAHDFNNLLTGILGNLSLAEIKEEGGEDIKELLEEAKDAALQAKELTQQLLTFSKGGEPIKGEVSIEEIIRKTAEFALRGSNVKCSYDFPKGLWKVEVDKGQIAQVIENLTINAKQAMPEGGEIKIKAENLILENSQPIPLKKGKYIKITFMDEGVGIPEENLPRIFDPFFTTKKRGSGLGLAIVHSIIQKHNGFITVDSKLKSGTTFFIYLPAMEKKLEEIVKEEIRIDSTLKGKGKILVMDDEETVRNTIKGILKTLGYSVLLTKNGEEAIRKYKEAIKKKEPFDAVILI
ncbi:MAG: PAS domain S-box protein [candidate division WOR-3 bacterium]